MAAIAVGAATARGQASAAVRGRRAAAAVRRCAPRAAVAGADVAAAPALEYTETGKWREDFDLKAWASEVRAIERETKAEAGEADMRHLGKIVAWANGCYVAGLALSGFSAAAPLAALLVSTGVVARWTMVGHHVCHGGYNSLQSEGGMITGRYHRRTFARGLRRRVTDWLDWMLPEAWDVEHNQLHHFQLGEEADPDLVERNLQPAFAGWPMWVKYAASAFIMVSWKWYYYMPNTLKELCKRDTGRNAQKGLNKVDFKCGTKPATTISLLDEAIKGNAAPLLATAKVAAPYFLFHFALVPGAFLVAAGPTAAMTSLAVMATAELLTNLHSFIVIATNHAGKDVYRFETTTKPKSDEFLLRACIGSVNFRTGGDLNDFAHGWLNYQIEHHMFPDMSMLQYQRMQPKVKAACERHGVPYVQENVFKRLQRTVDIMVGKANMLVWERGQ